MTGSDPVVRVSFPAAAGQSYVIQRSDDRQQWVNVMTVPASMARLIEIATSRGRSRRFYRAVPAETRATALSQVKAAEWDDEPACATAVF